jgi:hypothetical protein
MCSHDDGSVQGSQTPSRSHSVANEMLYELRYHLQHNRDSMINRGPVSRGVMGKIAGSYSAPSHLPKSRCGNTGRGGAIFDAEFRVNVFEMFADSCRRDLKNGSDLGVGFSASELGEHFKFARGEGTVLVWPVRVGFINLFPSYSQ